MGALEGAAMVPVGAVGAAVVELEVGLGATERAVPGTGVAVGRSRSHLAAVGPGNSLGKWKGSCSGKSSGGKSPGKGLCLGAGVVSQGMAD